MNTRLRYLPLPEVAAGMVLGSPLVLAEHGVISFSLPADHVLTESNIHQMQVRQAEFVCVQEEDERNDEARAIAWQQAEQRVQQVFRGADLAQPAVARLYQAVLNYRKA